MTLILSFLGGRRLVQVSDRLTTQSLGSNRVKIFDEKFNKSLICMFDDGPFFVSFAGNAFIGNLHTDSFLASVFGHSDPLAPEFNQVRFGKCKKRLGTVSQAIYRLITTLASVDQKALRNSHLEFVFVGWRGAPIKPPLPSHYHLKKPPGSLTFTLSTPQSRRKFDHYHRNFSSFLAHPEGHLLPEEINNIFRSVASLKEDAIVSEFINVIRDVSSRSNLVGKSCVSMHVDFSEPHQPLVKALYHPESRDDHSIAYSPWLVSRNLLVPPSLFDRSSGFQRVNVVWNCAGIRTQMGTVGMSDQEPTETSSKKGRFEFKIQSRKLGPRR